MVSLDTEAILKRRELFPRGLIQPEGGYRFSLDSLLLACFFSPGRSHVGVDLGCGCGVIGLGLLLRNPGIRLTCIDLNEQAIIATRKNAEQLHFSEKMTAVQGSVLDWRPEKVVDFVVSNPPYRELGRGRTSRGDGRKTARFETEADFVAFARCAAIALKTRGKFAFIHLPERVPELMAGLEAAGLAPKRMQFVHGRADEAAKMVMLEAVKAGGAGVKVEPPLILHAGHGANTGLTQDALEFCPFLICNSEAR